MNTRFRIAGETRLRALAVFFFGILLAGPGCQAPGPRLIRDASGEFASSNAALITVSAEQELAEAKRMLRAGEHSRVIPRLTGITTQYSGTDAGTEAWYLLGLTYYEIDGLYNAERCFERYLGLAPDGPYAAISRDYVAGIKSITETQGAARAALEARVAKYDGVDRPEELAANLELANAYWTESEFEKAGVVYVRVLRTWPSLKDDAIIRRRMEPGPDGGYVVITPNELERRQSDAEPLSIYNIQSFRSGEFRANHDEYNVEYYNVTGQAVNRGESPIYDAAVIVTIYGMGGQVYDTQTVQLGQINPGVVRAFSVRFSNFDNIENVHRHECIGTYSR